MRLSWWGLALAASFGILLGLGGYTVQYAEGASYLSNDPASCVNCHIMQPQYDAWQKASHHAVATCVDCHLPHDFVPKWLAKSENGIFHSKGFTLQDFHEPIFIRDKNVEVLNANCLRCHDDLVHDLLIDPKRPTGDAQCLHCHRSVGHGDAVGLGKRILIDNEPEVNATP